jgi:NADH:ubiquinone oxidoreductase subunit 5 (subunit L)/multisubunit Na+/H+ antiporter MnhA subunit
MFCIVCTAFYSIKMLYFIFNTIPNGFFIHYKKIHELSNSFILFCLSTLALLSLIFGSLTYKIFIESNFLNNSLNLYKIPLFLEFNIPFLINQLPLIMIFSGTFLSYKNFKYPLYYSNLLNFFLCLTYIESLINKGLNFLLNFIYTHFLFYLDYVVFR